MDNVAFHHSKVIKQLPIDKGINPLYTVPYTPDLNPIENVFSVIKHYVRKNNPKTKSALKENINASVRKINPESLTKMFKRSFGLSDFVIRKW